MTTKERTSWLEGLLGTVKAKEVVTDLEEAKQKADELGLTPKAMPEDEPQDTPPAEAPADEAPPEPTPEEEKQDDVAGEAGVKLAQQIFDATGGDLSTLTVEQLGTLIGDALRPAVEEEPMPEAAPAPEGQPPAEREEEMAGKSLPLAVSAKDVAELVAQMAKDQGEMARHYQELVTSAEATKSLTPVIEKLEAAVAKIQAELDGRPRSASRDPVTVIDDETEQGKALKEAAEKSLREEKRVLGVKVKNTPK